MSNNGFQSDVMVTRGLGDVEVVVLEGVSLSHEGKEVKPGETFRCHVSQAMQLAARGCVEIKGEA